MLRQRKSYAPRETRVKWGAILFALFIFVSGVFSPVISSKLSPNVNTALAQSGNDVTAPIGSGLSGDDDSTDPDAIPGCGTIGEGTILGCVAQFIYYIPYGISQWLAGLSAGFLDWVMFQSISSEMYEISFVAHGWEIVRDLSNMAFIFVLLYFAIDMILGGHGAKKGFATLIIVALFINFSMFISKVVIDSGNILAHAFYNSLPASEPTTNQSTASEPKSITELLIDKVDPQKLMTPAILGASVSYYTSWESFYCHSLWTEDMYEYDTCKAEQIADSDISTTAGNTGYFILITFLAMGINIAIIWTFVSVGFMLVGRIVGLIFAIVISPLAFISKVVPGLSGMSYIGFDKWLSDLFKMSFLPAAFLFFIYLIIQFIEPDALFGPLFDASLTGEEKVLGIIIPFIFIIAMLIIAKNIAAKLSGEVGGMVGGAVGKMTAVVGGLALGGMAMGGAFVGRQTVGRFMKGSSTGDTASQRFERGESRGRVDRFMGRMGSGMGISNAERWVGRRLNRDQTRVEGYAHARHDLDAGAQARYHKKYEELNQTERANVHDTIDRNIVSRQIHGNRRYSELNDTDQAAVRTAVTAQRATAAGVDHGAAYLVRQSRGKQGLVSNLVQSTRNGSFDVRNISQIANKEFDRNFSKIMTVSMALLAGGVRSGLKAGLVDHGKGSSDIFKDMGESLKHAIEEGFKAVKVKVDVPEAHAEEKEGHGHGGGHH